MNSHQDNGHHAQVVEGLCPGQRWLCLPVIICLLLMSSCSSCRRSPTVNTNNAPPADPSAPPFIAKEPDQYRATRVTTYHNVEGGPPPQQTGIARDGSRSRLDLVLGGQPVSLLEIPEGKFLVSPERVVFARLRADEATGLPPTLEAALDPDLAPARLLNQGDFRTEYRRVRPDQFGGRAVTIYQVLVHAGKDRTESLLWVDDATGFPLRTEVSELVDGVLQPTGFVTEIRDLVLGPPPAGWFTVPPNHREVTMAEFWRPPTGAGHQ